MKKIAAVICAFVLLCAAAPGFAENSAVSVVPGAGQSDAAAIQEGTYTGTCAGSGWITFTTGPDAGTEYILALENVTPGSGALEAVLYDDFGFDVEGSALQAENDGRRHPCRLNNLEPDARYYMELKSAEPTDFILILKGPAAAVQGGQPDVEQPAERAYVKPSGKKAEAAALELNRKIVSQLVDGRAWFSFTTGPEAGKAYSVTVTNMLGETGNLQVVLCDDAGGSVHRFGDRYELSTNADLMVAPASGAPASACGINILQPDTTYYVCVYKYMSKERGTYSLMVCDTAEPVDAEARSTLDAGEKIPLATNADDACLLRNNVRYEGTSLAGGGWIAFRTGSRPGVDYTVSLEHTDPGRKTITGRIYDALGSLLQKQVVRATENWRSDFDLEADEGGRISSCTMALEPDSTYLIHLESREPADYLLRVNDPAGENPVPGEEEPEASLEQETASENTSQSRAEALPLNTRVFGRYTEGSRWYCFTTNDNVKAVYRISAVNRTVNTEPLWGFLYDGEGYRLERRGNGYVFCTDVDRLDQGDAMFIAGWDGTASTGEFAGLKTDTTYYVLIRGKSAEDFSLKVSVDSGVKGGIRTSSTMTESLAAVLPDDIFTVGTNQNDAILIRTDMQYRGHLDSGYGWLAFRTGDMPDTRYTFSVQNITPGSQYVEGYLFDEFGYKQIPTQTSGNYREGLMFRADESGEAYTADFDGVLLPDTIYYIRLSSESGGDYYLNIASPVSTENGNTIAEETPVPTEEPAVTPEPTVAPTPAPTPEPTPEPVFEVPFELNETQVRFVTDQAVFLDPDAAVRACEPVAKVILSHPGHQILLAGSTATMPASRQESCEALSLSRANAVKQLLVERFGVPEEQLLTVGLGFEKDPFERGQDRGRDGRFIESEARKNRRVVLIDADTPIARELLNP